MPGEVFPAAGRVRDPTERSRVSEHRRGWNGSPDDPHKHREREASMHHLPKGRDSRTLSDLEASAEDGGDASQTAAPEEVREMGDTDRVPTRPFRKSAHSEGGGKSSRGAHTESLPHRKLVGQTNREETRRWRGQSTGHILRDGQRPWGVRDHSDARAGTGREPGFGPGSQFEHDTRADRAASPGVTLGGLRPENARDVAGSECAGDQFAGDGHRPRPEVPIVGTYKPTRCMIGDVTVSGQSLQP